MFYWEKHQLVRCGPIGTTKARGCGRRRTAIGSSVFRRTSSCREVNEFDKPRLRRTGFVSVWIGTFPSVEAAEAYFGIPDEIGVFLPPEAFATDLSVDEQLLEKLEVNFERTSPRPIWELLNEATFSGAFRDQAAEAASRLGISSEQGIALVYDFDYQAKPDWQHSTGPLTFIGTFPFHGTLEAEGSIPKRDPRIEFREIADNVL